MKIWFTEKLEPALSKIQVFDTSGLEVDQRDAKIDQSNAALLTVSLPELKPGKYKVVWRAVSVDTHVTTGNFTFELTLTWRLHPRCRPRRLHSDLLLCRLR